MDTLKKMAEAGAAKQAFSLVEEFKAFAFKGNVVDLAIGVIIGGAFGKIIDSLVKHIIMPVIGLLMPGKHGYLEWKFVVGANEIPFGLFIGEVVNFVIVAAALFFFLVKFLNFVMRSKEEVAAAPQAPAPTRDQELLSEIRDILKTKQA